MHSPNAEFCVNCVKARYEDLKQRTLNAYYAQHEEIEALRMQLGIDPESNDGYWFLCIVVIEFLYVLVFLYVLYVIGLL